MEQKRETGFDLLRILSILGFFICATAYRTVTQVDVGHTAYVPSFLYLCLGSFCIPMLLMLTGGYLLDPSHEFSYRKHFLRLIRIVVAALAWTCAYTIIMFAATGEAFTLKSFLITAFNQLFHMRYVLIFAGLYLTIPIFRVLVTNKKATQFFLVLSFIFASLLPLLSELPVVYRVRYLAGTLDMSMFGGLAWIMVAGYYFKANPLKLSLRVVTYVLSALALGLTIFCVFSRYTIVVKNISTITANFIVYALGIYVFFCNRSNKQPCCIKHGGAVAAISKCSFATYMVSLFFIKALSIIGLNGLSFVPAIAIPLTALLSCALSYGFVYIISGIPIVNKWLM